MSVKIHYEDNLFFLHSILRVVESGLRLEIDMEFFRDKILDDLLFIDAMIMRMNTALRENEHLLHRITYFRSLRRAITAYTVFLDQLLDGSMNGADAFEPYHEKLASSRSEHITLRHEVDAILDSVDPESSEETIVSSEEYGFLLAGDLQSDDSDEDSV